MADTTLGAWNDRCQTCTPLVAHGLLNRRQPVLSRGAKSRKRMSSERGSSERGRRAQRWLVFAACSAGLVAGGCAVEAGSDGDVPPVDDAGSVDAAESGEGTHATQP